MSSQIGPRVLFIFSVEASICVSASNQLTSAETDCSFVVEIMAEREFLSQSELLLLGCPDVSDLICP